jgi:hypothetical protein
MKDELDALMWQIADLRGLDSVFMVHSLLVECALACERKFGWSLLTDIRRLGVSKARDVSGEHAVYKYLYSSFIMNIHQKTGAPDDVQNVQEDFPLMIEEVLSHQGFDRHELCAIFKLAIDRAPSNALWPEYDANVFVSAARRTSSFH